MMYQISMRRLWKVERRWADLRNLRTDTGESPGFLMVSPLWKTEHCQCLHPRDPNMPRPKMLQWKNFLLIQRTRKWMALQQKTCLAIPIRGKHDHDQDFRWEIQGIDFLPPFHTSYPIPPTHWESESIKLLFHPLTWQMQAVLGFIPVWYQWGRRNKTWYGGSRQGYQSPVCSTPFLVSAGFEWIWISTSTWT